VADGPGVPREGWLNIGQRALGSNLLSAGNPYIPRVLLRWRNGHLRDQQPLHSQPSARKHGDEFHPQQTGQGVVYEVSWHRWINHKFGSRVFSDGDQKLPQ